MSYISAAQLRARNAALRAADSGAGEEAAQPLRGLASLREPKSDDDGSAEAEDSGARPPEAPASAGDHEKGAKEQVSNLPALIDALPSDSTRPSQTQFDLAAQTVFLEALATFGSVRSASRKAGHSHQSAYRMRRSSRPFRRAWDAAMLVAREGAAGELAERALNGVEEPVFYHGEEVGKRRRYSDRLLLAHLGRLDKLAASEDAAALAEDFDAMLERFGKGEALSRFPAKAGTSGSRTPSPGSPTFAGDHEGPENFPQNSGPSGPCLSETGESDGPPCPDCGGACDVPYAELGPEDCQWFGNRLERMNAARPMGVKKPHELARDMIIPFDEAQPDRLDLSDEVEALQLEAFEADGYEWWLVTTTEELMASCVRE